MSSAASGARTPTDRSGVRHWHDSTFRPGRSGLAALLILLALAPVRADDAPASLYFPTAGAPWTTATPSSAGLHAANIDAALEFAGQRKSTGLVVLHRGRMIVEHYWPRANDTLVLGRDAHGGPIQDVASTQKSVVMMLVGMAQDRGLLRTDDPVTRWLGPGWSRAPAADESAITVRHLLSMTSGLRNDLSLEASPGTKWYYNSAAYIQLHRILAKAAGRDLNELTKEWLTARIGMADSRWQLRGNSPAVTSLNPWGFRTTARDLARFGLLILAGGTWSGQPILRDRDFLDSALRPSQAMNPYYGYLIWLNGSGVTTRGENLPHGPTPEAPPDLVIARGARDQRVYVVPSRQLVVVRMGDSAGPDFDALLWRRLLAGPRG